MSMTSQSEKLNDTLVLGLTGTEVSILGTVVALIIFYIVYTMVSDHYQEKRLKEFYAWLEKISKCDVLQLYRNTDNYDRYYDTIIADAIKDKVQNNKHFVIWKANQGIELLWKDLLPFSKLRAQK
jgi:uncharacterized membrane protein